MDFSGLSATQPALPLESLRNFVEHVGGAWDEVEPQVYDLLLPAADAGAVEPGGQEMIRVAFDPDALPEHRDCQLAGFGTPLIDRFLAAAARRGRCCQAYRTGLNMQPHGLGTRVLRSLTFPAGNGLEWAARALFFPAAVYWFQATFVSDQKEYQLLPVGFDLHYAHKSGTSTGCWPPRTSANARTCSFRTPNTPRRPRSLRPRQGSGSHALSSGECPPA